MKKQQPVLLSFSDPSNISEWNTYFKSIDMGWKWFVWALSLVLMTFFFWWVAYYPGHEANLFSLNILPIMLASWRLGLGFGLTLSITASLLGISTEAAQNIGASLLLLSTTTITRIGSLSLLAYSGWKIQTLTELFLSSSLHDPLTHLFNRRGFFYQGELELERMARGHQTMSLVYLDIDNFKAINDTQGHDQGDKLLQYVSEFLQETIRKIDVLARLGGDEFAIILPSTNGKGALTLCRNIQEKLREIFSEKKIPISLSIGIATFKHTQKPLTFSKAIQYTDDLMYEVKNAHKDGLLQRDF